MFNQQEYINGYIKEKYKSVKIRVKNSDAVLIKKLSSTSNVNQYILDLIRKDIYENRVYHYINDDIKIDFELTKTMQDLVDKAEEADILEDYGLYMNYVYAIDSRAKKEVTNHLMRESTWNRLLKRYQL
ncbi:MAG: hypothetical protein MJ241_05190 [Bacilli bacterium]|nr:hypothetical protein [Bacilli bacterium]